MGVTVSVLVPQDRLGGFASASGAFLARGAMTAPDPGSSASGWTAVTVVVPEPRVRAFYVAFGAWVAAATASVPEPRLPVLTAAQRADPRWSRLPPRERELLLLLVDDDRRVVPWGELRAKLGLAEEPDLARDLPVTSWVCHALGCALPVEVVGEGSTAALAVPVDPAAATDPGALLALVRGVAGDPVYPGPRAATPTDPAAVGAPAHPGSPAVVSPAVVVPVLASPPGGQDDAHLGDGEQLGERGDVVLGHGEHVLDARAAGPGVEDRDVRQHEGSAPPAAG